MTAALGSVGRCIATGLAAPKACAGLLHPGGSVFCSLDGMTPKFCRAINQSQVCQSWTSVTYLEGWRCTCSKAQSILHHGWSNWACFA